MARCKNIGGGPDDEERHPPHLTAKEKDKGPKKVMTKNQRKRGDIEAEREAAVAAVAKCVERGGQSSGIHIGEAQFHLKGQELGTEGTEQPAAEEPTS